MRKIVLEARFIWRCCCFYWLIQYPDPLQGDCSWENVKVVTCYSYAQVYMLSLMEDGATADDFDAYTFGNYMVMIRK